MSNVPLSLSAAAKHWHAFFHGTTDALVYTLFRKGYAFLLLVYVSVLWPRVVFWFGESGCLPTSVANTLRVPASWSVLDWLPQKDYAPVIVLGALTLAAILLLLGLWSRLQALICFVLLVSLHNRNPMIMDSEDAVFRVFGFLLLWMPLGNRAAKDGIAWDGNATATVWPLRLVQMQICIIFIACGWSKLLSEDWLQGQAMYYTTRLHDLWGRFPVPAFMLESNFLMAWTGWLVIALEMQAPVMVWWKELRWPALIMAFLFHLAAEYTMNLFLFHWIMMLGWCTFITPEEWRALPALFKRTKRGS